MTAGATVLLGLESKLVPKRPNWTGSTLLMAEHGARVESVEITYITSPDEVGRASLGVEESLCLIEPDGTTRWEPLRARVRVVVIGSDGEHLTAEQKRALLGVLGSISQASGVELVPVRLADSSDVRQQPGLPPQAADLCALLERKGIIR